MPRKKSKENIDALPRKSLQNITNRLDPIYYKCVVKMQKINLDKSAGEECPKDRKRKVELNDRENNNAISPPKRSSNQALAEMSNNDDASMTPSKENTNNAVEQELSSTKAHDSPPSSSLSPADASVERVIKRYEMLQLAISKKYMNQVERLKLDYMPYCAANVDHCLRNHLKNRSPPPTASVTQVNLIRNAMQQSRYKVFINLVSNLCQKGEFPGDMVLTNIVKLILTLNPASKHNTFLQEVLDQLVWLFDVILRTFPPCWMALRPHYRKFFSNVIEMSHIMPDKSFQAKNTIFEMVLMLLEDTTDDRGIAHNSRASRQTKDLNNTLTHFDDEYHNMQHWEKHDNDEQTFSALSRGTRLDRLMQVLHFIAKILEMDLTMWLFRYHRHPSKFIYGNAQPLVVSLFSLSKYMRSSVLVKKVMTLFAQCTERSFDEYYLAIIERYISLLAHVQNICDIECTSDGIQYPTVGAATSSFTMELFKVTEANIKKNVATYMRLIKTLRCPFVIFEYVDLFLNRLNPATGKMCPEKIIENFRKNRFLECEPDTERPKNSDSRTASIVYRSDYLRLLLYALRSYCEFHGTKELFHIVMSGKDNETSKTSATLSKRQSTSVAHKINLAQMEAKITSLEANADLSLVWRTEPLALPPVNIRVNAKLFGKYRNDIKQTMILQIYLTALKQEVDDDFTEILDYLNDFASVV